MAEEYWVNVYATGKGDIAHKSEYWAKYYAKLASDYRILHYRIHVKMKKVKGLSREYPLKMIKGHNWPIANVEPKVPACTCSPMDTIGFPGCQHRYAYSECLKSALNNGLTVKTKFNPLVKPKYEFRNTKDNCNWMG